MAGYIFSLDSLDSLRLYTRNGVYATKLSPPSGSWKVHHEGTFADYATMQAGDHIYFFIQRKIYGIGKLVNLQGACKFLNFPEAGQPHQFEYATIQPLLLWDEGETSVNQRCLCVFEPDPYFFMSGIDMDDVLSSNPSAFKMLRAFWKLSFIKFDDEENQAFRDILLKRHQEVLAHPEIQKEIFAFQPAHAQIAPKLSHGTYNLTTGMSTVLSHCAISDCIKHEMAIETGILSQLTARDPETCRMFGNWDYLSHQVIASPFKPIDYMDKMDLFGYAYLPGFKPTKSASLVGEIKKDAARMEDVDQLMKYVDWVKDEYCFGDYSMIKAFLVAFEFHHDVIRHKSAIGIRKYTVGVRPAQSFEWNNLTLLKYVFNPIVKKIDFTLIS